MNSCTFTGRLGKDPELRSLPSGQTVCNFSLAVDRFKRDADAMWLDVSVWGKQGENCAKYLRKGSEAAVAGSIDYRTYERRDGETGVSLELNAREVSFIGPKADGGGQSAPRQDNGYAPAPADDDIPF